MKRPVIVTATIIFLGGLALPGRAQMPVPPPAPMGQILSGPELEQLLEPIALYPDPLIAEILPAATLPSQIVLADRYMSGGGDPNLIDQQPWDPSIKALARYPGVLSMMDGNLPWTTELGQAFLDQQPDVMNSIQSLRAQAQTLGNLQSSPQENVVADNGDIEILPTDPGIVYVPVYQPDLVFFQRPYGRPFITFGAGFALGAWLNHDFDWHNHHLIEWGSDHPRPGDWWVRRPGERPRADFGHATVWQPRDHPGVIAAPRNDRGWNNGVGRQIVSRPVVRAPVTRPAPVERRETPAPVARRPEPVAQRPAMQRPVAVANPRPATGALIGVQSARATQQMSSRGQESRAAVPVRSPGKR